MKIAEMMAIPPTELLIPPFLPKGEFTMLFAEPLAGKTTGLLSILADIYEHGEFLGESIAPMNTLYFTEDAPASMSRYLSIVRMPMSEERLDFRLTDQGSIAEVGQAFDGSGADLTGVLLIVDTAAGWLNIEDNNDYGAVNRAVKPLREISRKHGVTVLCTHHVAKGSDNSLHAALGSTAWNGASDNSIRLSVHNKIETRRCFAWSGRGVGYGKVELDWEDGRYLLASTNDQFDDLFEGKGKEYAKPTKELEMLTGLKTNTLKRKLEKAGVAYELDGMKRIWYLPE